MRWASTALLLLCACGGRHGDENFGLASGKGASVDLRAEWLPPSPLSLDTWKHRSSVGRDTVVVTAHVGYLFPFGHRARFVIIRERKFDPDPAHPSHAAFIGKARTRCLQAGAFGFDRAAICD